ncbi:ABC transporter ATP-binding protein [Oceaniserpentilla sp. 4NH20-0058]|uniref:ABC transporter ATP-binding protein n=1 Tax=Oceaniserpentilla sp. 4NH20-0058 TaxID=3127660 RepID=UPI003109F762
MTESAIKATNLTRQFGDFTAVNKLNLSVSKGQIYGFLGPNGCGKSTTLRMLTGLLKPTSGQVSVLGLSIPECAEQLRLRVGYMTQKFSLYDDLTVEENLKFMGEIFGLSGRILNKRIAQQVSVYGLNKRLKQRVSSMSGGEKQRLALSAATIHNPDVLLLDEPTSAVDPENRRDFWEKLFDLSDVGTTILVTTHYMDEAERCHGLAIMDKGEIKVDGPPEKLMQNMGVTVVEVETDQPRQLKQILLSLPQVRSVAQLGVRLRVLVDETITEPINWLIGQLPTLHNAQLSLARPSLEDVFVSATGEAHK